MTVSIHHASCLDWLAEYDGPLFDSCVTDPPYHLTSIVKRFGGKNAAEAKVGATGAYARASKGFMGKEWDGGDIAFRPETWRAIYDVLKPGAHLVAFSGTRTYHRMACAIEDAGFEIRDQLGWAYGSGFPKSHDVSKGIDKAAGVEREVVGVNPNHRQVVSWKQSSTGEKHDLTAPATPEAEQWQGWGTALKPSWEPICLARKPLSEKSVAANVLKHGTGAINIDACRVEAPDGYHEREVRQTGDHFSIASGKQVRDTKFAPAANGRWPANLIHDGSDEVLAGFPETGAASIGKPRGAKSGDGWGMTATGAEYDDNGGSAARFFYSAKAGPLDRIGTAHATVKPVDLMRWLVRMVTPPGGHILEPFAGSGTTGIAAMAEGFDCTMIELEAEHVADIERKLAFLRGEGALTFQEHNHAKLQRAKETPLGGLFGGAA